jgi:hypothetical protein
VRSRESGSEPSIEAITSDWCNDRKGARTAALLLSRAKGSEGSVE